MNIRTELKDTYFHLKKAFGVENWGWSQIHEHYSPSIFCKENRLNIIGEYLVWKDFVEDAKKYDIPYYLGIDTFLEEYKKAVESRINFN